MHRTPCLETAQVKMLLNGPESFTPDGNFILGEAPELRRYFVAAGFNSAGIANSGGAGRLIAEWIVGGSPQSDLWDVDIRRFGPFMANRKALSERTGETLGLHYAMRWPRQELETARPLRTSPLYDLLAAKGAVFGARTAGSAPTTSAPRRRAARRPYPHTLGKPDWLGRRDRRAAGDARGGRALRPDLVRQAAAAGPRRARRAAAAVRQRRSTSPPGRMVYTAMLNERGGFESDLTVIRLGARPLPHRHRLGAADARRRLDRAATSAPDEHATLTDVSALTAVLSVMGPNARELLGRVAPRRPVAAQALKFSSTRARSTSASRGCAPRA